MIRRITLAASLFILFCGVATVSFAQSVTKEQIRSLIPGEQDLQGFVQVAAGSSTPGVPVKPVQDYIVLTHDPAVASQDWPSSFSESVSVGVVKRLFRSENNNFDLSIEVVVSESTETAQEQFAHLHSTAAAWKQGRLTNSDIIGDESMTPLSNGRFKTLIVRDGRLLVTIEGSASPKADTYHDFPPEAIEAVAYQILLRASQQPELTGVTNQQASVAVNGHALPKGALLVGKQVYVPVQAFAKAMGLTSQWDTKTGALTLSGVGRKTVAMTAGSVKVEGSAISLQVPVLKQAGQPVMTLDDLLMLTGGRIVGRSGNTVQVKA